jgi:hypothetical protein
MVFLLATLVVEAVIKKNRQETKKERNIIKSDTYLFRSHVLQLT